MAMQHRAKCLISLSLAGVSALFLSSRANAQAINWDWGGEKKVNGTGRELVQMSSAKRPGNIIVSFGDRKLYLVTKAGEALSYPIAIPRENARWQGTIAVTSKRENPSWTPTPTMRAENPKLPSWVPGGHPMNPLGVRAMYLGASTYRIHGTDAPWTIGTPASSGCVRMYNQDVADLYPRVRVGASVLVTWEKFRSTPDPDAKIAEAVEAGDTQRRRKLDDKPFLRSAGKAVAGSKSADIETGSLPSETLAAEAETKSPGRPSTSPVSPRAAQLRKRPAAPIAKKYIPPEELSI